MQTIKDQLYLTVMESAMPIEEIADEIGADSTWLRNAVTPGRTERFPVELLLSLMLATGKFNVLHHLAHRSGMLLVDPPMLTSESPGDVYESIGKIWIDVTRHVTNYLDSPTIGQKNLCLSALTRLIEEAHRLRMLISKSQTVTTSHNGRK